MLNLLFEIQVGNSVPVTIASFTVKIKYPEGKSGEKIAILHAPEQGGGGRGAQKKVHSRNSTMLSVGPVGGKPR